MTDDLRMYYNYLYPFQTLVRWLTYNYSTPFTHRQLSFQYEIIGVQRYVKFKDADAMKVRMISRDNTPLKVDAGAIWNQIPEKNSNGHTLERELVFDFDMDAYDDVRTCCKNRDICVLCWKFLIVAVQILERALWEDYGFKEIMYVFSGGRGLHIWVCDKKARQLKDSLRKAIVDYLELVTGNDKAHSLLSENVIRPIEDKFVKAERQQDAKRENMKNHFLSNYCSYHVVRSLRILREHATTIFTEQRVFESEKCQKIMLNVLGARHLQLKERVASKWESSMDKAPEVMWKIMVEEIELYEKSGTNYPSKDMEKETKFKRLTFAEEQILLSFLYPRMDFNVSTMQNHLLKLPFSVHPKTKKISIPLFKSEIGRFDPNECVTVSTLLRQVEQLRDEGTIDGFVNEKLAKRTSLVSPIAAMEEFINSLH